MLRRRHARSVASLPMSPVRSSFVRYGLLAAFSFALNLGLTAFLHEVVALPAEAAFAISLVVVFATNFTACRYFVFDAGSERGLSGQVGLFLFSSLAFRGSEYLLFLLFHTVVGLPYLGVVAAVLGLSFLAKFGYYRGFVFGPRAASGT